MKKIITFIAINILSFNCAVAQTNFLGVYFGIGSSKINLKSFPAYPNYKFDISNVIKPIEGVRFEHYNKAKFLYCIELNYISRDFNNKIQSYDQQNVLIVTVESDHHLRCFETPLSIGKQFGSKLLYGIKLGIIPYYFFKAEIINSTGRNQNLIDNIHTINVDGQGTLFLGYQLNKSFEIKGEFRYQRSFVQLYKEGTAGQPYYGFSRVISYGISLNYKFKSLVSDKK